MSQSSSVRFQLIGVLVFTACLSQAIAQRPPSIEASAARYVPEVNWRANSVVRGNFSCQGRMESAILGTSQSQIVIAIFLNGSTQPPEVLRYSAKARRAASAVLAIEDMSLDLKEFEKDVGYVPEGLRPSKTCKGLNLSDGYIDSAHIFWNHVARRFDDWSR